MNPVPVRSGSVVLDWEQFSSDNVPEEVKIWTQNDSLLAWIRSRVDLCRPSSVHLCDGSSEEYHGVCLDLVNKGTLIPLNPDKRPGSYCCFSDPCDVARVEEATFICSNTPDDAGPTNNWRDPAEMKRTLTGLFSGCMEGRTLYVIPFCMGSLDSPFSLVGVQITDSPYVVCSMYIMTRIGVKALRKLRETGRFIPCLHSVGRPLQPGEKDVPWPCNPEKKYIVHFPEERAVWSYGSGYGGNALLGKKSVALRIGSVLGRDEGWLAEHMLIIGVTNPAGKKKYMAAAFPSQCGKTNLALLFSKLPGWKVECIGDDIAWIRKGPDGRLYAVNPEAGFFGVAPGTSPLSNPYAIRTVEKNTIFTNVALTADKDVWWEGLTPEPPPGLTDWRGLPYDPASGNPAAHPNARFTASTANCPVMDPGSRLPEGVPISAILFGGRRSSTVPLVYEALSKTHAVLLGASVSSETTAAATGIVGKLRHDPFAMLPFCGYHMGDYFAHWIATAQNVELFPSVFYVNWFRKDSEGNFVWPGFGENLRVLQWIFEREEGAANYVETAIGLVPSHDALNLTGLDDVDVASLCAVDREEWAAEIEEMKTYFSLFGDRLPRALWEELERLRTRIETV